MYGYFGIIEILSVENEVLSLYKSRENKVVFKEMKSQDVIVIHYEDCQQIIIMIPQPATEYGMVKLWDRKHNTVIEDATVISRTNGSIQIVWDTLQVPPGLYLIELDWQNSWQHTITFIKHKEVKKAATAESYLPIYVTKETVLTNTKNCDRKIEYEGNLRAGTIRYIEDDLQIKFDHEMGGGDCLFYIFIPSQLQWEATTKTSVERRNEILDYVANTVKNKQASSSRFEITETQISFYPY